MTGSPRRLVYVGNDAALAARIRHRFDASDSGVDVVVNGTLDPTCCAEAGCNALILAVILDCRNPGTEPAALIEQAGAACRGKPTLIISGSRDLSTSLDPVRFPQSNLLESEDSGQIVELLPEAVEDLIHGRKGPAASLGAAAAPAMAQGSAVEGSDRAIFAVVGLSASGRIVSVDDVFCRMSGVRSGSLLGREIGSVIRVERALAEADWMQHLAEGRSTSLRREGALIRDDGTERRIALYATAMERGESRRELVVAVVHDLGDAVLAQDRIADVERRLREVQHVAGLSFWEFYPESGLVHWSPEWHAEKTDLPGALAPKNGAMLDNLDADTRSSAIAQEAVPGSVNTVEYRSIGPDGSQRHMVDDFQVEVDRHGAPLRYFGVTRDVTDRRRFEEALTKEKALSETILDAEPALVMVLDRQGTIIRWNRTCQDVTGYGSSELVGTRTLFDLFLLSADAGIAKEIVADLSTSAGPTVLEAAVVTKAGSTRIVAWSYAVVDDPSGSELIIASGIDITEQKRAEAIIRHQASYDALTGLPNRSLFLGRLAQMLDSAERGGGMLSVLLVDLDRFKAINDALGHRAGDRLLTESARRLQAECRATDMVARLGGDEFIVLLDGIGDPARAREFADSIRDRLSAPYRIADQDEFVSCCVGITLYPFDAADTEGLLRNADTALHRAKEAGRNRVALFHPEMNRRAVQRRELERDLRTALDKEQFFLAYQPIVDSEDLSIVGAEALIRWMHPERGLVAPDEFVGLAEETGLIQPIGEWVLNEVCRQGYQWHQSGHAVSLSVNVSALQCRRDDFVTQVGQALAQSGFAARYLSIEITESLMLHDVDAVVERLRALRNAGVHIALDDFGTGFSSLSYLRRLPVDTLKIDRAFVNDIDEGGDDAVLVDAILAMADSFRMTSIGEGVETEEQLAYLRSRGCRFLQGYLFSRPLPPAEFETLISGGGG